MPYPITEPTMRPPRTPGWKPDRLDERDLWEDEARLAGGLQGSDLGTLPKKHFVEGLKFENQYIYPYCVPFGITKIAEWLGYQKTGKQIELSEASLFYRGGGSRTGASVRDVLLAAKVGNVLREKLPTPTMGPDRFDELKKEAEIIVPNPNLRIGGFIRLNQNPVDLAKALVNYNLILTVVAASTGQYWKNDKLYPPGLTYNHLNVQKGFDRSERFYAHDSIQRDATFDGTHTFAWGYEFLSAYAIVDLTDDWKKTIEEYRKFVFPNCLARYGKTPDYMAEAKAEIELLQWCRKSKDEGIKHTIARNLRVYRNAVAYGGYNVRYWKWGILHDGDTINDAYRYRRDGYHEFDFDRVRSNQ